MPSVEINYVAVLAAAVVNMLVGAVWYSKSLFGQTWADALGKKVEDMSGGGSAYGWMALGSLVLAYILAKFVGYAQADTFSEGLLVGGLAWLGFVLPTMGANALFEGKKQNLIAINVFYPLASMLIMGALLAVWR